MREGTGMPADGQADAPGIDDRLPSGKDPGAEDVAVTAEDEALPDVKGPPDELRFRAEANPKRANPLQEIDFIRVDAPVAQKNFGFVDLGGRKAEEPAALRLAEFAPDKGRHGARAFAVSQELTPVAGFPTAGFVDC
jgi:hypothetical protein